MLIRSIREDELPAVRGLCYRAFGRNIDGTETLDQTVSMFRERPSSRMRAAYRDTVAAFGDAGEPFASVSHAIYPVSFAGAETTLCGVGDVACVLKGTDAVARLFKAVLERRRAEGVPFSLLFAFSGAYYAKLGYSYCGFRNRWTVDLTRLARGAGGRGCVEPYEPGLFAEVAAVQRTLAARYDLAVLREEIDWRPFMENKDRRVLVCRDGDGRVAGSLAYQDSGEGAAAVADVSWSDPSALGAFLAHLREGGFSRATAVLPEDVRLDMLVDELNLEPALCRREPAGMARIVDLPAAVAALGGGNDAELVLRVEDALLPENSGCWELVRRGGISSAARADKSPDAELDVGRLSRLLCGGVPADALPLLVSSTGRAREKLAAFFPPRRPGALEYL